MKKEILYSMYSITWEQLVCGGNKMFKICLVLTNLWEICCGNERLGIKFGKIC